MIQTFKVQRPLFRSDGENVWLFYNEDGSIRFEAPPTEELTAVMGDNFKIYAQFRLTREGWKYVNQVEGMVW